MTRTQAEDVLGGSSSPVGNHPLSALARANQAAVISLVLFVLIVLKVLIVSRFDTTTALAVVRHAGTANVLVGVVTSTAGAVALAASALGIWWLGDDRSDTPRLTRSVAGLALVGAAVLQAWHLAVVIILIAVVLVDPWPITWLLRRERDRRLRQIDQKLHAAVAGLQTSLDDAASELGDDVNAQIEQSVSEVSAALRIVAEEHERTRKAVRARARTGPALAIVALVQVLFALAQFCDDRVWLPAERMFITDEEPLTAFVVAADGSDLVVLTSSDRKVVRVPGREVLARGLCRTRSEPTSVARSIVGWLAGDTPSYPGCSDLDEQNDL